MWHESFIILVTSRDPTRNDAHLPSVNDSAHVPGGYWVFKYCKVSHKALRHVCTQQGLHMKVLPRTKHLMFKQRHCFYQAWTIPEGNRLGTEITPFLVAFGILMLPPLQWSSVDQHLNGKVLGHTVTSLIKYNASPFWDFQHCKPYREALLQKTCWICRAF